MDANNAMVILVVGHTSKRKGAKNERYPELNEYDVNLRLATMLKQQLSQKSIRSVVVSDLTMAKKKKLINNTCRMFGNITTIQISLHFNAYEGYISNTSGCEVLVSDKKLQSAVLAESLLNEFGTMNVDRGIKIRSKGSRGYAILNTETDYSVLCEPLFIDSEEGETLLDPTMTDFLVDSYLSGIMNFIEKI